MALETDKHFETAL